MTNKDFTASQVILSIAAAVMCMAVVLIGRAIHAHLRQQHPTVWEKFGNYETNVSRNCCGDGDGWRPPQSLFC